MGFEAGDGLLFTNSRNGFNENFWEDFESEEQVENFILQPARESCRKMFSVGLSRFKGTLVVYESVKTLTNGIFLKSTFKQEDSGRSDSQYSTYVPDENVESEELNTSEKDSLSNASDSSDSFYKCSETSASSNFTSARDSSSISTDIDESSSSSDALRKMVRSILLSAVKCETEDSNNNIVITSHWCEICLVYDPNGANKHMDYHIAPTKLFLKRVLGYEEIMHNYGSHPQSQQLPLCILESCAINLVHFNCVFEKGLMFMQNNMIYKQKRWLNLLLLEVLDFTSSIRKFRISDIRNLPSFGDDGGFMKTRLQSTEEGDSTLFSYVNAVAEFVKLLQFVNNKTFYSFNVLFESKLTEQEVEVASFLKRTKKLSNILNIFIKGWRESLKPKREIEIQATEMLSMDLWQQMLDSVVGLDLRILLTSFGSFMASYHGGNISKAGIQAILLLISDMLNTLLPIMEDNVEFKFEYLHNLHVAFFPVGWLDLALKQPCFNYDNSVCLPILSVSKFLMFLEVFNWYGEYSLNLDPIYKTIHGLCFPTYSFEVFKMQRI